MGIEWKDGLKGMPPWRESHFKAEGPVVAQMQAVFVDNWIKATGRVLHGAEYFPQLSTDCRRHGCADVRQLAGRRIRDRMHLMVLLALTAAKTSIDIENAYFVPDKLTVEALCSAARRGVRVRIVVPGRYTDARVGRWAAQGLYGALLEAGIQIYEYQPTMMHCKVLVIDGVWSSVGSSNFDDRSFRLNDEANLNVFSEDLAREQIAAHRCRHPAVAAHGAEEMAEPEVRPAGERAAGPAAAVAALVAADVERVAGVDRLEVLDVVAGAAQDLILEMPELGRAALERVEAADGCDHRGARAGYGRLAVTRHQHRLELRHRARARAPIRTVWCADNTSTTGRACAGRPRCTGPCCRGIDGARIATASYTLTASTCAARASSDSVCGPLMIVSWFFDGTWAGAASRAALTAADSFCLASLRSRYAANSRGPKFIPVLCVTKRANLSHQAGIPSRRMLVAYLRTVLP